MKCPNCGKKFDVQGKAMPDDELSGDAKGKKTGIAPKSKKVEDMMMIGK